MREKKDIFDVELDEEEKEMLASVERGEWKSVPKIKEMRKNVQQAAANYLRRNKIKTPK
jgi:hypothetical protein